MAPGNSATATHNSTFDPTTLFTAKNKKAQGVPAKGLRSALGGADRLDAARGV